MTAEDSGVTQPTAAVSLDAATSLTLSADTYLHGHLSQDFAASRAAQHRLVAATRQFSSFILLLGTMKSSNEFSPQHALVLQNKDEVIIPLLFEQLPSPQEFRDAIDEEEDKKDEEDEEAEGGGKGGGGEGDAEEGGGTN